MQAGGGQAGGERAHLIDQLDSARVALGSSQRQVLDVIARCDRLEVWRGDGFRDLAHWLSFRLGISSWAARRWINAAHTLPHLPLISDAFETGTLSFEKVLELCRFATPDTEEKLIKWAQRVTVSGIGR